MSSHSTQAGVAVLGTERGTDLIRHHNGERVADILDNAFQLVQAERAAGLQLSNNQETLATFDETTGESLVNNAVNVDWDAGLSAFVNTGSTSVIARPSVRAIFTGAEGNGRRRVRIKVTRSGGESFFVLSKARAASADDDTEIDATGREVELMPGDYIQFLVFSSALLGGSVSFGAGSVGSLAVLMTGTAPDFDQYQTKADAALEFSRRAVVYVDKVALAAAVGHGVGDEVSVKGGAKYIANAADTFQDQVDGHSAGGSYVDGVGVQWVMDVSRGINVRDFGALPGDNAANREAIQNAINRAAHASPSGTGKDQAFVEVNFNGEAYGVDDQILIEGPSAWRHCFVMLKNGGIHASDAFPAQATAADAPRPMIVIGKRAFGLRARDLFIDCKRKCSGICIDTDSNNSQHPHLEGLRVLRFANPLMINEVDHNPGGFTPPLNDTNAFRPYGIRIGSVSDTTPDSYGSSQATVDKCVCVQWQGSDPELSEYAKYTGIGIWVACADAKVNGCTVAKLRKGIVVDGHHNALIGNHPTPPTTDLYDEQNPMGEQIVSIELGVDAGETLLIGNYVDNGYVAVYKQKQTIVGNRFTKNPSATHDNVAGIAFIATELEQDQTTQDLIIAENRITSNLDYLMTYIEPPGTGFKQKLDGEYLGNMAAVGNKKFKFARQSDQNGVMELVSAGQKCFLQFTIGGEQKAVEIGADGDDFTVELDGAEVIRVSDQYLNLNGRELRKWRFRRRGANGSEDVGADNSGELMHVSSNAAVIKTLKSDALPGTVIQMVYEGDGSLALEPEAGALLDGEAVAKMLPSGQIVLLTVYKNSDGNSASWASMSGVLQ